MYNGWGTIYWDSSVGDTAAWGLYLQSPPNVGVADQPLVDEFTTNYIVGGDELCLAPNFDNYTSEMGAISGITSPSNGSAVFNGTSDYIKTPIITITSDGTISAWVYWKSGTSTILSQMPYSTNTTYFIVGSSGEIQLLYTGRGSVFDKFSTATGVVTSNQWTHISLSVNNYLPQFYVNGSAVTTTQTGTYASGESIVTNTMGMVNSIYWWNGNLANVAIWNRALSSDEINSVMWKQYEELSTAEISGLQAWYSLDSAEVFYDWYTYAQNQDATIENRTCVDNALNALSLL